MKQDLKMHKSFRLQAISSFTVALSIFPMFGSMDKITSISCHLLVILSKMVRWIGEDDLRIIRYRVCDKNIGT
jgi:hypothetical protein